MSADLQAPHGADSSDQTEQQLEDQIAEQAMILHTAQSREARFEAWNKLIGLHAMRSPQKVAELERERGLQ